MLRLLILLRQKIVFLFMLAALSGACAISSAADSSEPSWIKNQPLGINIDDFVISPDGEKIVFEYVEREEKSKKLGLGLLEWKTGKLRRIPYPEGKQLSQPAFFSDSKHLLLRLVKDRAMQSQLVKMNLNTLAYETLTPNARIIRSNPVMQPNTNNVLYADYRDSTFMLVLLNLDTQKEQIVLSSDNGFFKIMRPSFIAQDEIIFQARGPRNAALAEKASEITGHGASVVSYRLKFGHLPKFFSESAEREAYRPFGEGAFYSLSASEAGNVFAFVSVNPREPAHGNGKIIRELHQMKEGQISQLTNKQGTLVMSGISYDGSIIGFLADYLEPKTSDLFIYKLGTGEVISTNLRDRIKSDPSFILK